MDKLAFISNIIDTIISWPLVVAFFFLIFRKPISIVIKSLKRVKYRDLELEFEEMSVTDDDEVNTIASYLSRGAHSFQWFRENTEFNYSDKKFNKIVYSNPDLFKPIKIVKRDKDGEKSISGLPGMKLTVQARNLLNT